jgi:predicted PurR-regulated permease PerM
MTAEQILQITQIAFVIILFIPSLITIAVLIIVAYKFLPVMVRQVQQLIDNNSQLTKIAKQNADQIATTEQTMSGIKPELEKQTQAIEKGNSLILTQGIDFRSYQTLVSDNMSNHSSQIEALKKAFDSLPQQVVAAIDDTLKCQGILKEIQALRYEVGLVLNQQQSKKATGTFPIAPPNNGEQTT